MQLIQFRIRSLPIGLLAAIQMLIFFDVGAATTTTTSTPLVIKSPLKGAIVDATVTLSGACKSGLTVKITGAGIKVPLSTACSAGLFRQAIIFTQGEGTKSITVSQTDTAMNKVYSASTSFAVSTANLAVRFLSPVTNTYGNGKITITGTCYTGLYVALWDDGLAASTAAPCENKRFSATVSFSVGNGLKRVSISQTDAAGNATAQSRTFMNDTAPTPDPSTYNWKTLNIGGGGWIVEADLVLNASNSSQSVMVCRADVYGGYIWNPSRSKWVQLVTSSSMPAEDQNAICNATSACTQTSDGAYSLRIAPSNTDHLYMMFQGFLYSSINRGATWKKSTSFKRVNAFANDSTYHIWGQKMAVDPINENVVYAGTPENGLWVTENGGVSWLPVTAVPKSKMDSHNGNKYPGFAGIAFDPKSGTIQGKTKIIYINSFGNGVYRSQDAGETWAPISSSSAGPLSVTHAKVAPDGTYYAVSNDYPAGSLVTHLWRFRHGSWANITGANNNRVIQSIATNPFDQTGNHIVVAQQNGALSSSHDGGATWSGQATNYTRIGADVPWISTSITSTTFMSIGDVYFDPIVKNRLWSFNGVGVWRSDNLPETLSSTLRIPWMAQSAGIEELVTNYIVTPPGGHPLAGVWDFANFLITNPNDYVNNQASPQSVVGPSWAASYSLTYPNVLVQILNFKVAPNAAGSGYSLDGGKTWKTFASYPVPNTVIGGSIAVSDPSNIIIVPQGHNDPYVTQDRGVTWKKITLPKILTSGPGIETGWGKNYADNRQIVAADGATPGTFYLYNAGSYTSNSVHDATTYSAGSAGVYRSTNGGVAWTQMKVGKLHTVYPKNRNNILMKSTPGVANDLFFTEGAPGANPFLHSTDGGATWSAVPNVTAVGAFGFGRSVTDGGYPSLYILGQVNYEYGVYRSDDKGNSWVSLGVFPNHSLDLVKVVNGDMNTYGIAYVGFTGSGFAYFGP